VIFTNASACHVSANLADPPTLTGSEELNPVRWVGSSPKDLKSFPPEVKAEVGHALYVAQQGDTDPAAKPLKGFGGVSVMEIVAPFDGQYMASSVEPPERLRRYRG